jgi:hypothetical protein
VALLHQHALGGGPKTLGNATPADVVVPPVVGGPEQGRPVNGFVPVDRFRMPVGSAGETGASGPWTTVFPLITRLTVFPLRSGLLVFCASDTVVLKVTTRTLRPTSSRRFAVMIVLPFGRPKSFNAELLSGLPGTTPHDCSPLPAAVVRRKRYSMTAAPTA